MIENADTVTITTEPAYYILTEVLGIRKLFVQWVHSHRHFWGAYMHDIRQMLYSSSLAMTNV